MAALTETNSFAAVAQINLHFVAVCMSKSTIEECLSLQLETNIKTAQAVARSFAEYNKIPYNSGLFLLTKPIYSVTQIDDEWYPMEMSSSQGTILFSRDGDSRSITLGGSYTQATKWAKMLATQNKSKFFPTLGSAS